MHADHSFPRYGGIWRVRLQMAGACAVSLVLMLALAACSIHIGSSASASGTDTNGTTVQVKVMRGQDGATLVLLPVMINGKGPFSFALDTGASTSLIDSPLAQQLNLPQNGMPQDITGVSGKEQAIPVRIDNWSVGKNLRLPSSTVSSADLFASQRSSGLQGLIGSDIWAQFGKITIDYDAQTLTVYNQISLLAGGSAGQVASILVGEIVLPRAVETRRAA